MEEVLDTLLTDDETLDVVVDEFELLVSAHLSGHVSPGSMPPLLLMSCHAEIAPISSQVGGGLESPVCQ